MRTKTMLLSALLGGLGSISVMAQTNVYSLNAVGYINVTCAPGFTMIACPLMASPNNTIGTLLNNASSNLTGSEVFFYNPASGGLVSDTAENVGSGAKLTTTNADGWALGGTNVLSPGAACWFQNTFTTNVVLTFVGTVPSGSLTNTLVVGYNMISSILPMSGDIVTNSLSSFTNYDIGDDVFVYNTTNGFTSYGSGSGKLFTSGYKSNWNSLGDPIVPNVGQGFWWQNNGTTPIIWVENYSVAQ